MNRDAPQVRKRLARFLKEMLLRGASVELDGLGKLSRGQNDELRFFAETKPRVFIAYVEEDLERASRIFDKLTAGGFQPWLDKRKLAPGQNWPRGIETAIETSDFFIACFSKRSVRKRGSFHCELRYALECAARVPLDEIFFIPVRLENCVVPARISTQIQYVDLFPDWDIGMKRVLSVMNAQERLRARERLLLAG